MSILDLGDRRLAYWDSGSGPFLRRSCARLKRLIPQADTIALERSGHAVNVQARDEVVSILGQIAGRA